MSFVHALSLADLPPNSKKAVTLPGPDASEVKILLVRTEDRASGEPTLFAVEAECPHAKAPLEKGAVCDSRLVCPFHAGTFALETGAVLEPPPLRDLKRYAVELEQDSVRVDPTPLQPQRPEARGAGKHVVFAGGGAATAAALCYLRDQGFAGRLTVIEPHTDEPVDRTQLTKNALAGKIPLEKLALLHAPQSTAEPAPPSFAHVQASVSALNRAAKQVTLSDGQSVAYDALLLATGGAPKHLEIPGAELPHVFTIRHTADLERMQPFLAEGRRVVCIGDSFIAFEAASALRQRGLHVTILARSRTPFAEKFGDEVAQALLQLHRSNGVTLHTEVEVEAITPVAVALADGSEIPADVVITAIGVEPTTGYATDLPQGEHGGFAVGLDLRLAPNVWTAGDIASVDGTRIEHWRLAQQHGRAAAASMLAYVSEDTQQLATDFANVPLFWTTHFGKRFNYAGHAQRWDRIVVEGDPSALNFLAYYMHGEDVAAVLGCGRDTAMAALMEPMRENLTLPEAQRITGAAA